RRPALTSVWSSQMRTRSNSTPWRFLSTTIAAPEDARMATQEYVIAVSGFLLLAPAFRHRAAMDAEQVAFQRRFQRRWHGIEAQPAAHAVGAGIARDLAGRKYQGRGQPVGRANPEQAGGLGRRFGQFQTGAARRPGQPAHRVGIFL